MSSFYSICNFFSTVFTIKQKSEYGANSVCGCAYDEEKHLLIAVKVDRADSRNGRMMTYRKE